MKIIEDRFERLNQNPTINLIANVKNGVINVCLLLVAYLLRKIMRNANDKNK